VVQYSVVPITTIHGRITAREYVDRLGDQVHPIIRTLFPNNNAVFQDNNVVFQDNNAPSHSAGIVQLWFEEHEGELQHLPWSAKSPDFHIIGQLWSVLEGRVRNSLPPPTSLKQFEDVLQEEWYEIPLEIVPNL
jgi:hypothetical protein